MATFQSPGLTEIDNQGPLIHCVGTCGVSLSATFVWLITGPTSFLCHRCLCSTTGLIKNLPDGKDSFSPFQNYSHDGFGGLFLVSVCFVVVVLGHTFRRTHAAFIIHSTETP